MQKKLEKLSEILPVKEAQKDKEVMEIDKKIRRIIKEIYDRNK